MNLKNMLSQRQMRFGEVIRSIIGESLIRGDFFNTEIDISAITVSFVKMSKDLRVASVYIMPLGGKNKYFFQKSVSKAKLKSKFIPKIKFYIDDSFDEADKIENLLLNKRVLRDLNNE